MIKKFSQDWKAPIKNKLKHQLRLNEPILSYRRHVYEEKFYCSLYLTNVNVEFAHVF